MTDKTEALQALTATYTDSEEEDDEPKSAPEPIQEDTSSVIINLTMGQVEEQQRQKAVAKLVSYYHDENDMVISEDDEGEKENSIDTSAEPTPTEEKEVELSPDDKDDIQLPPEPPGRCSQELQDKITRLYEKMQATGMNMNQVIQKRKDFRNPSIYEKLIQFCGINELGTNYDASMYDPLRWGKESYYEELAKAQKEEMDKKTKESKEKTTKVEIVVGTAKKPSGGSATVIKASGVAVSAEDKNRRSKWDQITGSGSLGPILPTAPLTTSVTGTKGTVISAFGSLPKKAKSSHS